MYIHIGPWYKNHNTYICTKTVCKSLFLLMLGWLWVISLKLLFVCADFIIVGDFNKQFIYQIKSWLDFTYILSVNFWWCSNPKNIFGLRNKLIWSDRCSPFLFNFYWFPGWILLRNIYIYSNLLHFSFCHRQ